MEKGQQGWVRRLWGYMLRHRKDVYLAIAAAVGGSACQAFVPLVERQIVDSVIVARHSSLWPWLSALIGLGAAAFGLAYIRRYRGGRVALAVQFDMRNAMHDHLQSMDFGNLDRMPTGQLVARANSDSTLVQGLLNLFPIMSGNILFMAISLGVTIYLSPLLAIVSVLVAPALIIVSYRMRWRVFPATWDGQQREGDVAQIVDEAVNGVRVVKAFGQEDRELTRLVDTASDLYGSQMRAVRLQSRYQPLLEAIPAFGQVALLGFGGWLALHHEITLGTFLAFSTYLAQMMAPARQLTGVLTVGQQARAGMERMFQLLDLPPAIADKADAVSLHRMEGDVELTDVHFSYAPGTQVLKGFDLHIRSGERVALVGPSGSGKSTVALLLARFYDPEQGEVRVDGYDLKDVTLGSVRSQVGMVFEESFLFSESVRNNIAFGRPEATDAEVEAAARAAAAHDFIMALPKGYDTVVGERGLTLSGGQRQRIALARAILYDPRILILDDATSAVDAKVEESIHEALREVLPGRTTLLIAHRTSTLELADRIVVLDNGRVIEQGEHHELLATSSSYRNLLAGIDEDDLTDSDLTHELDGLDELADLSLTNATTSTESSNVASLALRSPTRSKGTTHHVSATNIGPGLGGGGGKGGGGGWRMNLVPTPELLERVSALRPIKDKPKIDLIEESRQTPDFGLKRLLKDFRSPLLLGLVLVVLDSLASLAGPVMVRTGIDNGVLQGSSTVLFTATALYLLLTLIDLIDQTGETFVTGRTAQRIMLSLRIRIWAHLQRLSLDFYEREMAGRIMTRMTTDVDQFESLMENGLLAAVVALVTFFGVGIALVVMNTTLGLLTLSVIIPLAAATTVFRRRSSVLYDLSRERIAIVNADFQESLSGVRESQAFVHETETNKRFHRLGKDYLESRVAAQRLVATYFPFVQFLSAVAVAITLGVGSRLVREGSLATGALFAFILYIDMFFSPIQQLSQVFDSWQQTRVSVRRIAELMSVETATPPAPEASSIDLSGNVVFDDVHFRYNSALSRPGSAFAAQPSTDARSPEALSGLNLKILPGETIALVGETGAGKSTVMKLLARFYDPSSGAVRVDGHDLRELEIGSFRSQLGYVPQEAFLFSGSIRDNIAYGCPGASDAQVESAARSVGAHELIISLPGGYHHELTERGRSLSSGQRQLIALARAAMVDPAILLLDEATSNLDLASERKVSAAMQAVSTGRTTIIIAHRLQTAQSADRIVVIDGGQIIETGTHGELLTLGGKYAQMWRTFETSSPH